MVLDPKRYLTKTGLINAALRLNTDVAEVRTLAKVESGGQGFLDDGRVVIRFEPHLFHRFTKGKYAASHPHLSYEKLRKGNPRSVEHSYKLFREACALDANAAVRATSWGMFQILGDNFKACGCKSLNEFVFKMETSVDSQLFLTGNFLLSTGLAVYLREHNWVALARGYNGPGYKINQYDVQLAHWYGIFSR